MTTAFLYLFASFCWGLSYLAIGVMVHQIPPFMSGALRLTVASLFFCLCLVLRGRSLKMTVSDFKKIALLAIMLQALPFSFLFWGEQHVEPALAGILVSAVPIFVVLLSLVLRHEQEGILLKSVGVAFGFLGILIIFSPYLNIGDIEITGGAFAIIGTAICYAIGNILLRKWMGSIDRWTNITVQGFIASSMLWILSFISEDIPSINVLFVNTDILTAMLYLGIFSSGLAWIASFHIVEKLGSIRSSTICYPMALVSIFADVIYFKRPPSTETIIGTLFIFFGVFVVQFTPPLLERLQRGRLAESL
ncbi:MAG: hypothetical protein A3F16_05000 [Deltaproteobacteria bacterium RIFCSPHIGHO2_12_FULL_43_9]|nr:MAG: hypothetical protein A3F16_05000 [Deltaproteobacteria bacterium RIFCSPHIGHO2_12_FULL_43_9]